MGRVTVMMGREGTVSDWSPGFIQFSMEGTGFIIPAQRSRKEHEMPMNDHERELEPGSPDFWSELPTNASY